MSKRDHKKTKSRKTGATLGPLAGSELLDALGTGGVPKRVMHEPLRSPDDEVLNRHFAPGENASVSMDVDPELGDAAAELASDLARAYIDAATRDVNDEPDVEEPEDYPQDEASSDFAGTDEEDEEAEPPDDRR